MLSYDRVRMTLRGIRILPVILTEVVNNEDNNKLFPPMVRRDIQDVKCCVYKSVNW